MMEHVLCKHLNPPEAKTTIPVTPQWFGSGSQRQCSRAAVRGDLRIGCDEDDWGLMAGFSASQTYWMTIEIHFWVNCNHPG